MSTATASPDAAPIPETRSNASPTAVQHRVLIVGDGNFSYSLALAKAAKSRGDDTLQLTATSYDSYEELVAKYPESKRICAQLQELGTIVRHRVDATNLRESLVAAGADRELKFHSVVFNHPHCGEENVRRHQSLLSHFYSSALEVLEEDEQEDSGVLLTLAEGQPERWEAVQRATSAGLKLHRQVDDVDSDGRFGVAYERKRHQNGKSFHLVTLHGEKKQQESTLFIFRRQTEGEEGDAGKEAVAEVSAEKEVKVSRKRKAENELPLEFACTQCERSFKSAQGLRTHVHMVHELEGGAPKKVLLPCEFCDRTFKKEDARKQHQLAKHGKDPLIKPDWYEKQQSAATDAATSTESSASTGSDNATLSSSTAAASQSKTCSICQLSFTSSEDFDAHWQKLQPRAAAKRKCENCSREFDEERALRQHHNFCSAAILIHQSVKETAMSSAAYASDGGSSTESEDDSAYLQVKSEPNVEAMKSEVDVSVVVKSEVVESHVTKQEVKQEMVKQEEQVKQEALKQEFSSFDTAKQEPEQEEVQQEQVKLEQEQEQEEQNATIPPCCTACGFPVLLIPQDEIDKAKEMLDCKCCNLVLPNTSYSKTQRSESRKEFRKCKACTGNVNRGAKPLVQPTREKPKKPSNKQNKKAEKQKGVSAVFTNQVGRLKMAQRALQRKRDEASKLKMTKRREEYEQQLDKEEKELEQQSALLKRKNAKAFQSLMEDIKIKKPPTYEKEKKSKKKKAQSFEKKRASKRKVDESSEQASKKRKGPAVDSSVFVPSISASDEVPVRVIPTRSRAQPIEVRAR